MTPTPPAKKQRPPPPPRTPSEEWAYNTGMAEFMRERGFLGLAQSYDIAAAEWLDIVKAQRGAA
jgi:hypothetical protein